MAGSVSTGCAQVANSRGDAEVEYFWRRSGEHYVEGLDVPVNYALFLISIHSWYSVSDNSPPSLRSSSLIREVSG